jgi:type I restriction enzyme M protein
VVVNQPFRYRWEPREAMGETFPRYRRLRVPAARAALPERQRAIILPHGVLFWDGAEERIRAKLLKGGHIDTVIGLPAYLFYSTGIPVRILVLKKCKKPDDVLFINAAEHFVTGKRQDQPADDHITKISRRTRSGRSRSSGTPRERG